MAPPTRICPECLTRYPVDQVRCADPRHTGRLLAVDGSGGSGDRDDPRLGGLVDDRYLLLGLLGEGAMGIVYRAWQRSTAREVALKILPVDEALRRESPREYVELRARFRREIQLLARIDDACVARVYDSGELPDGGLYFAMERVQGQPLDRVLVTEGRLGPERVLRLARELARALGKVHALGLVHRDIKPSNLMSTKGRDGAEALKLVDFGIARAFEIDQAMGRAALTPLTMAGTILGSFAYMAPEQLGPVERASGVPKSHPIGPWTDVYAAGCTLFELLTGRLPFPGPTAPAFVYQHQSAPPPSLLAELDESPAVVALDELIARCLTKDPTARPRDGAGLLVALEDALRRAETPGRLARLTAQPPDELHADVRMFGPDDTVPEDHPMGAIAAALDPAAIQGISAALVRARVAAEGPARAQAAVVTKGRVAFGVAVALGLVTLGWGLFGPG